MASFFVAASEPAKKQSTLPNVQYNMDERKLMADILYEDLVNKRSTVTFDREERRMMAEIARRKDLESKANQSKQYAEKLLQMRSKQEEIEAAKIARAQAKLKRVESTEKPDLMSDTVKKYETKRSEVLERIHKMEEEKKMKLEKAMNREKPNLLSEVTKNYDGKRAEVLERIQKKKEETKLKYEQKMGKALPDKSALLPDIAKNYDKRRTEVLDRLTRIEEDKKMKLERKMERVENANQRHKGHIQLVREKSAMIDNGENLNESSDTKEDQDYNGESSEEIYEESVHTVGSNGEQNKAVKENNLVQGTQSRNTVGLMSSYNSLSTRTILPPIGCN